MSIVRAGLVPVAVFAALSALSGCAGEGAFVAEGLVQEHAVETAALAPVDERSSAHDQIALEADTGGLPETAKYVAEGKLQFSQGHYGLAIDAYSKSIERDALNAQAWLGLAASYDQVGRFDQADKAYGKVQELTGATPSVLNNLGYSYLLRGNLDKARATLAAAYTGDPGNPYIQNNIDILNDRLVALGHPPMVMNN